MSTLGMFTHVTQPSRSERSGVCERETECIFIMECTEKILQQKSEFLFLRIQLGPSLFCPVWFQVNTALPRPPQSYVWHRGAIYMHSILTGQLVLALRACKQMRLSNTGWNIQPNILGQYLQRAFCSSTKQNGWSSVAWALVDSRSVRVSQRG